MTPGTYDVAVIGGGPGGSSVATHMARGGLSVGLFEREAFPRFKVGESLVPATMLMLERLGVLEPIAEDIARVGGSHAQQDVFEETLVAAWIRAGEPDKAARALERRLARRPSPRAERWLARATTA